MEHGHISLFITIYTTKIYRESRKYEGDYELERQPTFSVTKSFQASVKSSKKGTTDITASNKFVGLR